MKEEEEKKWIIFWSFCSTTVDPPIILVKDKKNASKSKSQAKCQLWVV